jgi:enamine deaminase RidA (YjgF/YER057c/UK114 family)
MDLEAKLSALGLSLPEAPKPVAAYVPAVRAGNLLFVSGQVPRVAGELVTGSVPSQVAVGAAAEAARACVLGALAIVGDQLGGDWARLVRIVRVEVFVHSDRTFTDQPTVADGASQLLVELFGDAGRHARVAVGVSSLPLDVAVELALTAEVR